MQAAIPCIFLPRQHWFPSLSYTSSSTTPSSPHPLQAQPRIPARLIAPTSPHLTSFYTIADHITTDNDTVSSPPYIRCPSSARQSRSSLIKIQSVTNTIADNCHHTTNYPPTHHTMIDNLLLHHSPSFLTHIPQLNHTTVDPTHYTRVRDP